MSDPLPARRRLIVVLLVVLAGLAGATLWWVRRETPVLPPAVDLAGADPEVGGLIESARQDVLARPGAADRWGYLGKVLRAHGFADESGFCFAQAERLDPRDPRWPYYRGLTLVLTDPAGGLACLGRAVDRLEGGPTAPRYRLAEVLLQQGELDEAGRQVERALEIEPGHARGQLLRARLALARQDWKKALAAVKRCWHDSHSRRQAHLLAAEAWQRLGETSRAEQLLAQVRELPADVPWPDPLVEEVDGLVVGARARLALASRLAEQGQPEEAVAVLGQVVEDHPRELSAWLMLGELLLRRGRHEMAANALTRTIEIEPGSVEGWFHLGAARFAQGQRRKAGDAFRAVVRLKPDHTLAHYNLGVCLEQGGDPAGARQEFEAALRCQPDCAKARRALAGLDAKPPPKPTGP